MSNTVESNGPTPGKRRGSVVVFSSLGILVAVALAGRVIGSLGGGAQETGNAPAAQEMPPMPVDVAVAELGDVVDALSATGRIEAVQAVELRPDESGRVLELLFREGEAVAAGTPLVRLDDALLRAQAARAGAERDLAHQQLERVQRLRAENAAAPADLERAEAAARSADAAVAVLDVQIERSLVKAPFAGRVGQRFVSVGDYVTTATSLLTLQTTDPQRAVIEVPERYAGDLRVGQAIEFGIAAAPGRVFRARVEFIDPVVQTESRMIVVKARAPNPDQQLKAGMFIDAKLAIASRSGAVVVPEDAVQPLRAGNVVWAVVDGTAKRRVVTLGSRSRGVVEILEGVNAGEQVVVGGLERMAEGMPVAPRPPADSAGGGGGAAATGPTT